MSRKAPTREALTKSLDSSHLAGANLQYLEYSYGHYLSDKASMSPSELQAEWGEFFAALPELQGSHTATETEISYQEFLHDLNNLGLKSNGGAAIPSWQSETKADKQPGYDALINAYRIYGHKNAKINPLAGKSHFNEEELRLTLYGLTVDDLPREFSAKRLAVGQEKLSLQATIELLRKIYCGPLAAEFMYLSDREKKFWLLEKLESCRGDYAKTTQDSQLRIMERLVAAGGLEAALASKYPGTKRFGIEGGEVLIPAIDALAQQAGSLSVKEIVIAMPHRGRLNMLVNILGKKPKQLFEEFEGNVAVKKEKVHGDVKYHQGFSSNLDTPGGEVHLALAFNPSHLEIVSPVAAGSVRARQDRRNDPSGDKVLPIILHGDASFSGQGVVMETLQLSNLHGFKTGGTVHIILNNQIGFTVSRIGDARSTEYASDIAKMLEAPIFHVNGDDPDAVIFAAKLALEYRMKYHSDVVLDLVCYRRFGHNEADEPSITQPMMYKEIRKHPEVAEIYAAQLIESGVMTAAEFEQMKDDYREKLDRGAHVSLSLTSKPNTELFVDWQPYLGHEWEDEHDTSIKLAELRKIGAELLQVPEGFKLHRRVEKVFADRAAMLAGEKPVDWGLAELLAYGSLLKHGYSVRLTGQDSRRGTFSHRQAVLHEQSNGASYCPLEYMGSEQAKFHIYDAFLSEAATMAFEYGYAATSPTTLVLWEGQFGDFANGAQVVIDQFLSSGEAKWDRLCGLVLLLPHGYEGQGPEHSSARLERYLQLCADQNMQVCVPSSAGQIFHLLRRQIMRPLRKPLVVLMPKSMLRKEESSTMIDELAQAQFAPVINETDKKINPAQAERLILCSGKVYYELRQYRQQHKHKNTALVRLEQLYPFPHTQIQQILKPYKQVKDLVWCQEEPQNQGAWYNSKHHLDIVQRVCCPAAELRYAGRPLSASPADGYMAQHVRLQQALIAEAFSTRNL